ncbi:MAG: penicillin-binding transpeptidase domain-containing protein [Vallitaleaceae bacterium]|nr:penicillin-binding transpeptidase domain-containing protein [Vallitaleaceae bacterium]
MEKKTRTFRILKWFFFLLIASLIVYNVFYLIGPAFNDSINVYNDRLNSIKNTVIRGNIYDRNEVVLATTKNDNNEDMIRSYPYNDVFAHVVGYSEQGGMGVEKLAETYLLQSHSSLKQQVLQELSADRSVGDNVYTTLDAELQILAYDLLGDYNGSIIAMDPTTGQILTMVSKPAFDPNDIQSNWTELIMDIEGAPLLNRSTQGLYPPGSTYKIISTAAYLETNAADDFFYFCTGSDYFGNRLIHCYNETAHGRESLLEAFAHSCNTSYAYLGQQIDLKAFDNLNEKLLFNQPIPSSLPSSQSQFNLSTKPSDSSLAETIIGQGQTLMTPLHNLLITASIANGGTLMKPYLIDHIAAEDGQVIEKFYPKIENTFFDIETTRTLTDYMVAVVEEGTGSRISNDDYISAGKTGSAENDQGDSHAWFVGFAPVQNPKIAIVVLVENGGSGGSVAAPMAKALFDEYLLN